MLTGGEKQNSKLLASECAGELPRVDTERDDCGCRDAGTVSTPVQTEGENTNISNQCYIVGAKSAY